MKKNNLNIHNLITYGIVVAAFLFVSILVWTGNASRHLQAMLVPIGLNIILAVSLNLIVGFLGELTLGHAGFMSVGAYAGCLFAIKYAEILPTAVRFPLAMIIGGLVACVFGIIIGVPVLRLKGDYLAIVTLAFGEIIRSIIINLEFTGGASGLKGTPQNSNFYIVFVVIMITLVVITNLVNSRAGRAICSIRDNRIAAESLGINITYYKLLAFVIAAFFAGVAGVIYGHNLSILQASVFDYNRSIEILVIVVLGGMGSIRGSVIAAVIITALPEMLRSLADYRMLIYAVVLIAMMLLNGSQKFDKYKGRMNIGGLFTLLKNKKSAKEAG
ncbi:MAG: branched-chain amino acid ABC transporter permease [Clostridiales bacterium]|jgi:branched-chain amino acid transport system permease protein|nr:branched-chain amino acid ABC transporter permease [Clostridiales bacterium]